MTGKSLLCQVDKFGYEVQAVRAKRESSFTCPNDKSVEEQSISAANIKKISAAMYRVYETAPRLLPPIRTTAPSGLLVGI
jgi:hypothetical protein